MNAARWQEIKTAFDSLLELEPSLRSVEVGEIGVRDPELARALEGLLSAYFKESDDFLEIPAAALAPLDDDAERDPRLGMHVGPYQLERELGSGGMGEVYLARRIDAEFEQRVAIKLIRSGQDSAAVIRRFRAERQILANLDHPNIAKLLDGGRTLHGQPYFVMEYVAGLPITDYCDRHRLTIRERIELFLPACEGVQHAHQNAIIHRDLKPANILVIEVDGKAVPRIIDFGIAKAASVDLTDQTLLTRIGQFVGTPGFMSPEQADPNAKSIDSRTDVYSLGVILYVLLTGLQPFEMAPGKIPPLDVWLRQLREEEPPRPSRKVTLDTDTATAAAAVRSTSPKQLVSELRGDLDWIAMKALERERERRFATPLELAGDLRRYLNDEAVTARPANTGYQIRRFVRRHRFATAFIGMVTVLSVMASVAALIALKQKREAELQRSEAQHQTVETLKAQARLLTQAAAQRLKDNDVAGAQGIILEVLTNPQFSRERTAAAISVFQEVRAADAQLAVLAGHGESVLFAGWSPDGTRVVTASRDKTARIWDARSGAALAVLAGHDNLVISATYSPDGAHIVTASDDGSARIWDARSGAPLAVLAGHDGAVYSAAYSPDGISIVTASKDKTARIWDARTGRQVEILSGHTGQVLTAAYSPDGTRIVTASTDKTARIWDARSGGELAVLDGHGATVRSALYSPDGNRIVTASFDKTARIWDARSGAQLTVLSGHEDWVRYAAYSPDGTRIITASSDKTVRIWDASTGSQIALLTGGRERIYSAVYSPDGTRVVTASVDRTARIWDARHGAPLVVLAGHEGIVYSAAYSPDGLSIVTASYDNTARIWEARTGRQVAVLTGHTGQVASAAYSPNGTRIVTASDDNSARIWDARAGSELALLVGHDGMVQSAAYSPDGTRIVTASWDRTVRIWDARSGAQLAVLTGHGNGVFSAAYSPDGTRIVTASEDKTARIWDASSGMQLAVLAAGEEKVPSAAYSSDGTRVVTASFDKTARIWDARSGAPLVVLSGHGDWVRSAAYSPDGMRIVTASDDNTARIWDAHTGVQLAVLPGHRDGVQSAAYSPDGTHIVTAAGDKTARIWDARVPATMEAQILWYKASQTDPLADADRTELGLPPDGRVKQWQSRGSACDPAAAAFHDPDRMARGRLQEGIVAKIANAACTSQASSGNAPRLVYQAGRALLANSDVKGADAGEPHALARLAERTETQALDETDAQKSAGLLLQSFRYYAAASERAHDEDWPDDAWLQWRYRRASLARILASEGMMQQVADTYAEVLERTRRQVTIDP